MPIVVARTITELRRIANESRVAGKRIALVPTMGALHDGHLALVRRAAELAETVIVSIFVNPLQFSASEDLAKYPHSLDGDIAQIEPIGVTAVFAPSVAEMYPSGASETHVIAGQVGGLYEGRSRAGHFDGVLTVVAKLLNITRPDVVVFGQKDAQQVFLVRRMVVDLDIPVAVEVVPTVRENGGLALSSRNRFLDTAQKRAALGLSDALHAAVASAHLGVEPALAAAQSVLSSQTLLAVDYLKVVHPATFLLVEPDYRGAAVIIVAARVGVTRLIDNSSIQLGQSAR